MYACTGSALTAVHLAKHIFCDLLALGRCLGSPNWEAKARYLYPKLIEGEETPWTSVELGAWVLLVYQIGDILCMLGPGSEDFRADLRATLGDGGPQYGHDAGRPATCQHARRPGLGVGSTTGAGRGTGPAGGTSSNPRDPPQARGSASKIPKPDYFEGERDPVAMDQWLYHLGHFLVLQATPVDQQVRYAAMYLKGAALLWWLQREGQVARGEVAPFVTLDDFVAGVRNQFAPVHAQVAARDRLATLVQKTMVAAYIEEFLAVVLVILGMTEEEISSHEACEARRIERCM